MDAKDSYGNTVEETVNFEIIVTDLNDNRPSFENLEYTISLKEHAEFGTVVSLDKGDK